MTDKVTMIELFSGIGAQERAIKQLNIPYEVLNTCDCDKDAVLSYAAMRNDFEKEFAEFEFPSQDRMIEELQAKNIGFDFQKGKHTITSRTSVSKLKQYYLADKLSHNLGDIGKVDKLPYADIVTYSYPCTDLSVAGKGEGMVNKCDKCGHTWFIDFEKPEVNNVCSNCGNIDIKSTRSGLLGQVQRLLTVSYKEGTLPKYLLLENVKNLVGKKFKPQFDAWVNWLDLIGYNTYYKVLNAKHYGVPQNRERIFAVSIRKDVDDGTFKFPEQIPLTNRLKDLLEKNVDEKYYLPDDRIEKILNSTFMQEKKRIQMTDVCDTLLARDWKDPKCVPVEEPFIVASRGRNPDNPSDRTTGAHTEQRLEPNFSGCTNTLTSVQKDNYVCEPQVLRAERTEYGKAIRKQYEAGEIDEKIGNMREMKPRTDGVSNTITTLLKDNYVVEPVVCEERKDEGIRLFKDDCVGTLRTIDACGDKRVIEPQLEFVGGLGDKDWAKDGKKLSRNYPQGSRVYSSDGVAAALTSQGVGGSGGFSGLYAIDEKIRWRIRKLITKECWRLMGFSDQDHNRAAQYVSDSALYKQAGNSICTCCLISIFNALLKHDSSSNYAQYLIHFND